MKSLSEDKRRLMKENGWNLKSYCLKGLAKKDLYTGEPLEYSNYEKYLMIDFVNKKNMAGYLKTLPNPDGYINEKIKLRVERDGWLFFPSQTECRSLRDIPAINVMIECGYLFDIELDKRYKYDLLLKKPSGSIPYFIDSREQKPLKLKQSQVQKLAYGDYCANLPDFNGVFVERKSIQDLWGTLGSGYDRFKKEIARVEDDGAYLIVMVDFKLYKALSYNHNKKFSKCTAQFIFKRIRDIMQSSKNIQFVFSGGRDESKKALDIIYSNTDIIKEVDIQYMIDNKKFF